MRCLLVDDVQAKENAVALRLVAIPDLRIESISTRRTRPNGTLLEVEHQATLREGSEDLVDEILRLRLTGSRNTAFAPQPRLRAVGY